MKVFWKMRLSYGWSWQAVSFLFAVSECWRVKSHKGTIFCVIRDCPVINDHYTAIGDRTNQSLEGGIDMHPSPWQPGSRERAKRTSTLQLLFKSKPLPCDGGRGGNSFCYHLWTFSWVTWHLLDCLWKTDSMRRWSNKWGTEPRTSGVLAQLEEMVYRTWRAALLESG